METGGGRQRGGGGTAAVPAPHTRAHQSQGGLALRLHLVPASCLVRYTAQVIHPQPPSAYNPRDLLASSEILITHSPGDSDMQRVPTHVFLREQSSQKEKEKTKMQETTITRLLRRSLAERPLMFASAFAQVVGANAHASSADSLVRNSAKLQLNYNQFREGLRAAGMGLGDEDFEMVCCSRRRRCHSHAPLLHCYTHAPRLHCYSQVWTRCTQGQRDTVSLGRLARTLGHAPSTAGGGRGEEDGDGVAPEALMNGQALNHELQENVARQRMTHRLLHARGDIVRQLQTAAGSSSSGCVDEALFGQVLAASGVQMSSADRAWFWNAMAGGQASTPDQIAHALDNWQMPVEEAGALVDGPMSQRPQHLRTALGRGLVNCSDVQDVRQGEEEEGMGKGAAVKAFAAQRVKDALLAELPKVSRLFHEQPNGLSFSDFFRGLGANGVRLSEGDASAVWLQMAPSVAHTVSAAVARQVLGLPSPLKASSRAQLANGEMRDRIADGKLRLQLAQRVREVRGVAAAAARGLWG